MSKYGETHDIFSTHHVQTKAKLDLLLAKNTEIEINNDGVEALIGTGNASLASVDSKVVAVDTGACVVASSALPSGASVSAKQDEIKTLITATNSALAGTITVSAPASTKSSSTPISAQSVAMATTFLSGEIDLSTARHISIFGSCDNVDDSHELDLMVSNESGGTFFPTSHSGYFLEGNYHALITNIPYRYVKLQLVNGNTTTATTFTIHISQSD